MPHAPSPTTVTDLPRGDSSIAPAPSSVRDPMGNRPTDPLILDSLLTLGFIISAPGAQHQLLYLSLIPVTSAALRISRAAGLTLLLGRRGDPGRLRQCHLGQRRGQEQRNGNGATPAES